MRTKMSYTRREKIIGLRRMGKNATVQATLRWRGKWIQFYLLPGRAGKVENRFVICSFPVRGVPISGMVSGSLIRTVAECGKRVQGFCRDGQYVQMNILLSPAPSSAIEPDVHAVKGQLMRPPVQYSQTTYFFRGTHDG